MNQMIENFSAKFDRLEGSKGKETVEASSSPLKMEIEDDLNEAPSLHAISTTFLPRIMKVDGTLGEEKNVALIDSGSTHNFLSPHLSERVGLSPSGRRRVEVSVANGQKLVSLGKSTGVTLVLQGEPLLMDFYLLPLDGYEVVLGTQWLATLSPIWWDFKRLQMKFGVDGREITLRGVQPLIMAHRNQDEAAI
uniref:Uncharacterized protein n=1 Tax=Nelumbo nucifera TaxID=4432 RepID=A0A822YU58_NELNU|nr:TPA_asm: hypothetical protein HUJ06_005731 [Nelumbo nucifera]